MGSWKARKVGKKAYDLLGEDDEIHFVEEDPEPDPAPNLTPNLSPNLTSNLEPEVAKDEVPGARGEDLPGKPVLIGKPAMLGQPGPLGQPRTASTAPDDTAKLEAERFAKLKKLVQVSKRLKVGQMAELLPMAERELNARLVDWAAEFGFTLDMDVVEFGEGKKDDFIDALNKEFAEWGQQQGGKI